MSADERAVFVDLVAGIDRKHFRPSDTLLLCRYCEACVLAEQAARELRAGAVINGRPSPWLVVQEKAVRAVIALAMRLRLSPQSRQPRAATGRPQPTGPRPWE